METHKFCNVENLRRVHDKGEKFNKSNLWCFVINYKHMHSAN